MGSSLTTFAVILRDKDAVGPTGVSIILLAMLVPNVLRKMDQPMIGVLSMLT